jgi:DNA processing protein
MAVNRVSCLRPLEKFRVMALCPGVDAFAGMTKADLERILNRPVEEATRPGQWYLEAAEKDRKGLTRGRFQCTFYWSREYPPQLREIYDPPLLLYYRGNLPDWSKPLVAIVGTRHPTGHARECSYALAVELAGLGFTTVSGLARGIDAEAHRGSSDGGGRSIAVLGNGVDILFPGSSAQVGRSLLARGGALVSEYPPADPPLAHNFPARNRIISGLARTTVVVQAPLRSGALITAEYALEQGRELVVHRAGTAGERGAGSRSLAEQGAAIVEGAADILGDWGWLQGDAGKQLAATLEKELAGGAAA